MAKLDKRKNIVAISLSAAVGGFVAGLADIVAKGEGASAIEKIADTATEVAGMVFPSFVVVFLLMGLAVALCFIFEVQTKKKAFFVGASILSIIMTFVPYELTLSSSPLTNPNKKAVESSTEGSRSYNFFSPALCFAQAPDETRPLVRVRIHLVTDDERPISEAIVILRESQNRKIVARFKFAGSDFVFYQLAGDYIITAEVPGYRIAELKINVQAGGGPESLFVIPLKSTWIPLPLQRFLK